MCMCATKSKTKAWGEESHTMWETFEQFSICSYVVPITVLQQYTAQNVSTLQQYFCFITKHLSCHRSATHRSIATKLYYYSSFQLTAFLADWSVFCRMYTIALATNNSLSILQATQANRSTQPCIPLGSLNRVSASAGVRAGMSPLPGGR